MNNPNDAKSKLPAPGVNFIEAIINRDRETGKHGGKVTTRFPPEPNGYLHIGHAKSICLNFGLALKYGGKCHLRFDDTNPEKEDQEFVDSIMADVKWLGFDWGKNLFHASDYFDKLYDFAVQLIKLGKAYVCDLSGDQMRETRGTLNQPGRESPFRNRSVKENLDLFERMKKGEFKDGEKTVRAKIDMNSPNINMRDPVIFRIRHESHQRTGSTWCIYPMYDYTHCLSDMLEGITHSICTLEFEDHRPLYDWVLETLKTPCHPQQIEFARLNLDYTVMSKRKLTQLVDEGHVSGWDDPRLPTLAGFRRRGVPPEAIRQFCDIIGVGKKETIISMNILEECIREELNRTALRGMCILRPLKVVITNYPDGKSETLEVSNHPHKPELGKRAMPFGREIYIERDDFREVADKDFFRLIPGGEVRLRFAYVLTCTKVIKDPKSGEVSELHCTYDPDTLGGKTPPGKKKVKGIIHWVSATHGVPVTVRVYDRLFKVENPAASEDFLKLINPQSLETIANAVIEPHLKSAPAGERYQFERLGYFCADTKESKPGKPLFNRIVTLRMTSDGSVG